MVSVSPLIVAVAGAVAAVPAPSAAPTQLQEIGHVHATICTAIVVHANGAISQALDNDRALAIVTTNLRAIDFDRENEMQRRNSLASLVTAVEPVRRNARSAKYEIKLLRQYAQTSPNPERQVELKAFADALSGALQRQQDAAMDVVRAVTIIQGREQAQRMHDEITTPSVADMMAPPVMGIDNSPAMAPPAPPRDGEWDGTMQGIASSLDDRIASIRIDEGSAADHSIPATTGC